ncbi:MAG: hypothetical protein GDA40_11390 [Rhodobacteraceae bacterium]|nr:hypothetical protein [Paracoccaceae bacterium]
MAARKKRCKIHYRRLRREGANLPPESFSQLIEAALRGSIGGVALADDPKLRLMSLSPQSTAQMLANYLDIGEKHVFGCSCIFTPGQMQALLHTEPSSAEAHGALQDAINAYEVQELRAIEGNEYVGGICYWLAIEDHFYQIQHISLQAKQMEDYFNWLLCKKTKTVAPPGFIELMTVFDRQQVGGDLGEISTIEVGGIAPETTPKAAVDTPASPPGSDGKITKFVKDQAPATFSKVKEVMRVLLGEARTKQVMDKIPEDAALDVRVNIGYKAKRRRFDKEFMENIASGLRHLPDGEMRVRGKNGDIKGDDIRLSEDMSVKKHDDNENSSLLDLEDALLKMLELHRRFIHDNKI